MARINDPKRFQSDYLERIPNTDFAIGERIYCHPLKAEGHIIGSEGNGTILIVTLLDGDTVHVPTGDCTDGGNEACGTGPDRYPNWS